MNVLIKTFAPTTTLKTMRKRHYLNKKIFIYTYYTYIYVCFNVKKLNLYVKNILIIHTIKLSCSFQAK